MIYCKELDKSFSTNEEMIKELIVNKEFIIKSKTAQIYKSCEKGGSISVTQENILKALETEKALKLDNDYYYFVVNSSNILDSHRDIHIKGNWNKTAKEQQGKVFLVFDHQLKRSEIVAMKEDIELITAEIPFASIGKNYEGKTYVLIYKVKKDKIVNAEAKEWLEKGYSFEASVRMQYMDISIAVKSTNPDYAKENADYEKFYPMIANIDEFDEEVVYFWVIKEAKNVFESSLVMFGSNSATGQIQENKQAEQSLENKEEPSNDTQETEEIPTEKRKLSII
jgi:hypothetical protein